MLLRNISAILAVALALTVTNVQAQDQEASIIIEANPIGNATDGVFNVSISVSPRSTYISPQGTSKDGSGSVPIDISLPWYVGISMPQCVGDCQGLPKAGPGNKISASVQDGWQSTAVIVFSMTVTDDSYSAAGIVVRAGASRESLYVPITQSANRQRDTMGVVSVVSLIQIPEPSEEFVVDIDVSLPLSGGAVAIVPPGMRVGADSGCVDANTREPSDHNQTCMAHINRQPNGETWFQVMLPSGSYSMRIHLTPEIGFENGSIEISAGGRYFETEIVVVNVPGDFQAEPPK